MSKLRELIYSEEESEKCLHHLLDSQDIRMRRSDGKKREKRNS